MCGCAGVCLVPFQNTWAQVSAPLPAPAPCSRSLREAVVGIQYWCLPPVWEAQMELPVSAVGGLSPGCYGHLGGLSDTIQSAKSVISQHGALLLKPAELYFSWDSSLETAVLRHNTLCRQHRAPSHTAPLHSGGLGPQRELGQSCFPVSADPLASLLLK